MQDWRWTMDDDGPKPMVCSICYLSYSDDLKTFFSHEYFPFMEHIEYLEIVFYLNSNKILIYIFDNWWKFSFMDA